MVSRRSFICFMAALPLVGKLFAEPKTSVADWSIPFDGCTDVLVLERALTKHEINSIACGEWVHLMISNSDGTIRIFVNGKQQEGF